MTIHESGIAANLLEIALQAAAANGLARVTGVTLRVGALAGVEVGALRFAWQVLTAGTAAEGAAMTVEDVPIIARCNFCECEFNPDPDDFTCPLCEGNDTNLIGGRELDLKSIQGVPYDPE